MIHPMHLVVDIPSQLNQRIQDVPESFPCLLLVIAILLVVGKRLADLPE